MRSEFLGVPIDLLTMEETVTACRELIESGLHAEHVSMNAGKFVLLEHDLQLRDMVTHADLVGADGQSIVWAARALGVAVPERVAGIDLMKELLSLSEINGYPVYFLGARADVLERTLSVVMADYPKLNVVGQHDGFYTNSNAVADEIAQSGARVLFLGMPSPQKEIFLHEQRRRLGPLLGVGVGGSFDVIAGVTKRAPLWMQKIGLEWFFRFIQEPRRMWRRYLVGNARFMWIVVKRGVLAR